MLPWAGGYGPVEQWLEGRGADLGVCECFHRTAYGDLDGSEYLQAEQAAKGDADVGVAQEPKVRA